MECDLILINGYLRMNAESVGNTDQEFAVANVLCIRLHSVCSSSSSSSIQE